MAKSADAFRTISEVADWLETPAHVLRFWESKFRQIKPVKRAGGRRYYRPSDMLLLGGIKKLLHTDGMTIKGVQKLLREQGVKKVSAHSQPLDDITVGEVEEAEEVTTAKTITPPAETIAEFQSETTEPSPSDRESVTVDTAAQSGLETSHKDATSQADHPQDRADTETESEQEPELALGADAPSDTAAEDVSGAADEVEDAIIMPSFSHRAVETAPDAPSETEETAPPAPAPLAVDVPDDPADDIAAGSGVLSRIASLKSPIPKDLADHLSAVLDRIREDGDGNGPRQGN